MVCAIEDQSEGIEWYNGDYSITEATGTAIGTGLSNTDAIIAVQGSVETNYAAGLARAYRGGGYIDWFLPSKDELNKIYLNTRVIDAAILVHGGYKLFGSYWSSTEDSSSLTWRQSLNYDDSQYYGSQYSDYKERTYYVRAIRRF